MGIGVWRVQKMLGKNFLSIGDLCTYEGIKKWSKRKPYRSSKHGSLTEAEIMDLNYGFDMDDAKVSSPQQVITKLNQGYDWVYLKPRGSAFNEHYRLFDFWVSESDKYDHSAESWFSKWGILEGAGGYINTTPSVFTQKKSYKIYMETPFSLLYNRMKVWYSKPTNGLFFGVLAWSVDGDIYFCKYGTFASAPSDYKILIEPPTDVPLKSFKFAPTVTTCASGTAGTQDLDGNTILKWNKVSGTATSTWAGDWWVLPVTPFETRIEATTTGLPEVWQKYALCGIYEKQGGQTAIKITRTSSGYDIKFYIMIGSKQVDNVASFMRYDINAKVFVDSNSTEIKEGKAINKSVSQGQQYWIGTDLQLSNTSDSLYQFDDGYVGFHNVAANGSIKVQFEIYAEATTYNKTGYKYLVFQNGEQFLPTNIGSSIIITNPTVSYSGT